MLVEYAYDSRRKILTVRLFGEVTDPDLIDYAGNAVGDPSAQVDRTAGLRTRLQ